ncbi:MAG: hypothetical protein ACLGIJ_09070 [Candidatus Limnocylindria bacterium]
MAGDPRCGAAAEGGFNLKIEAEDLGVGDYGPITITYFNGKYVSWAIHPDYLDTYDADTVIVKGGPNAMIYQYSKTDGVYPDTNPPDDSDTRLTAPRNSTAHSPSTTASATSSSASTRRPEPIPYPQPTSAPAGRPGALRRPGGSYGARRIPA